MATLNLVEELQRYGASKTGVRLFDTPTPDDIRYLDLFKQPQIRTAQSSEVLPSGVVEYSDRPLIYLLRDDALSVAPQLRTDQVQRLIRSLACRGEGSYLAVVQPGELQIYPVLLSKSIPPPRTVRTTERHAPVLIQDLAIGALDWLRDRRLHEAAIHDLLFKLLTEVTKVLRDSPVLSRTPEKDEVLPLVGRALFTRFLIDRGIINEQTFPEIYNEGKPAECFSAPEPAELTCRWLDDKFNGDVLPLADGDYAPFFKNVHRRDKNVLRELSNVMYRAPGGVLTFDLFWNGIDFAHVPVGLLSEVYEDYAHRFFKDDARLESVRFTPRHIAEFTVNQAFHGLQEDARHRARLLDPAAGAGVFLVLGLQRLVAENWRVSGERPDTKKIRDILDNQIRGFDINTSALTLGALSLYLTALELDPAPYPPEKLGFNKILGNVLFNMRVEHEAYPYGKPVLGSLGSEGARAEHLGKFDVVVGNPPWTAWSGETGRMLTEHVNTMVRQIVKARARNKELTEIAESYEHNDMVPDIAFVWRSAQWAKEDGVIALILHARILFKRGEKGASMREALLHSFRITGILNGAELIKLWPHLNQPFCILFARNRISQPGDTFRYVTPELERAPDGGFQMRIDSESAQPIQLEALKRQPFLLKSLFRGGRLDVELIKWLNALAVPQTVDIDHEEEERSDIIRNAPVIPSRAVRFSELWSEESGLFSGQGYFPGTEQKTTALLALKGKRLTKDDTVGLFISAPKLDRFTDRAARWPRDPRIYLPPLVLISEGFYATPEGVRARLYLGRTPLIFNRSFYGYSTAGHPRAKELAEYLFVLASSDLFAYYILQSSAKIGVERRTALKEDIGDFPVIKIESLSQNNLNRMRQIVDRLSLDDPKSWRVLNDWVNDLYQLTTTDSQIIKDTLSTRMPFDAATKNALRPATAREKRDFVQSVETILIPFFKSTKDEIRGTLLDMPANSWVVFDLQMDSHGNGSADAITEAALLIADHERSSRIMQEMGTGHLRLAIRNQYRYLTKTRARLCAIDILREKGHLFPVGEK